MGDIYKSTLKGQEKELIAAYITIERRIQELHEVFGIKFTSIESASISQKLMNLKANIYAFISSAKNTYTIPDKCFDNLTTFANRLAYLASKEF